MQSQIPLSPAQEQAVTAPWRGTINMILSTAGSGKTLTLTRRAVWIASELVRRNEMSARILCVCFNKSAADEMHERIDDEISHQHLYNKICVTRQSTSYPDQVTIEVRTFHALGFWVLRTCTPEQRELLGMAWGKITLLAGRELHAVVLEALREAGSIPDQMPERKANALARSMSSNFAEAKRKRCDAECQAKLWDTEPVERQSSDYVRAFQLFEQRMRERRAVEYTDMITMAIKLANEHAGMRSKLGSRFASVLVDEFQDMSPSDFTFCKFFVDISNSLTVVGDDDQRIYAFRSSETWFCHESIRHCFSEKVKVFILPENRRCPGSVVMAADAVVRRNTRRCEKSVSSTHPVGCPVRILGFRSESLEVLFLIRRVRKLLPKVRQCKEQILILFRTNSLLQRFQKEMIEAGIEVSRTVVDSKRGERFGPKTFGVFALITLISKTVDKEKFVWAAMTVSPSLEREPLLSAISAGDSTILKTEAARGEDSSESSPANDQEEYGVNSQPYSQAETMNQQKTEAASSNSSVSPLLDNLTSWFVVQKQAQQNFPHKEGFFKLLAACDRLKSELRHIVSMEDLVRKAEVILTEESGEMLDLDLEQVSSQQGSGSFAASQNDGIAGFDVLLDAAASIDKLECRPKPLRNADEPSDQCDSSHEEEDPDSIDFMDMFGKDDDKRRRKRRKLQGAGAEAKNREYGIAHKTKMGSQIDRLCEILSSSFLTAEKQTRRPRSKNSQPTVVLSTIHKAKGSQFAYVFLCGADRYNLPNGSWFNIMHGQPVDMQSPYVEEERRMFFVSLTRTQNQFTCSYHVSALAETQESLSEMRSPFLLELIEGVEGNSKCVQQYFVQNEDDLQKALKDFE